MDGGFLVSRMHPDSTCYLAYHSLRRRGNQRDTLDIAVFYGGNGYYAPGGECNGLLFFYHPDGRILICNSTTKERKFVPPSQLSDPLGHGDFYIAYGFGYDESSQDFKILRFFKRKGTDRSQPYNPDLPTRAEINSFRRNCWKRIRCPEGLSTVTYISDGRIGTFVNGNLYWAASFDEDVYDGCRNALLSFNLAAQDFSCSPLPFPTAGIDGPFDRLLQNIFELDGEVGAFVYEIADKTEPVRTFVDESRIGTQIWVWKPEEGSWEMKFRYPFGDVVKPLSLKYDRLFLEVRTGGDELTQLRVYNMKTDQFVDLEVYAYWGRMAVFPYRRSTFALPKCSRCRWIP